MSWISIDTGVPENFYIIPHTKTQNELLDIQLKTTKQVEENGKSSMRLNSEEIKHNQ